MDLDPTEEENKEEKDSRSAMIRELPPRTLDSFLDEAYENSADGIKFRYWLVMLSLGIANSSDASEILCLSYILSDEAFDSAILHNSAWRGGLLAAAVFFGMLIGGLIVGSLGDWLGRHPMLMLGLVCNSVAGILSAFVTDVWQLSALRCVAGLGIGATVPPLFTLVTELSPPNRRGLFVTFCASFWMVGSIYVALTALVILEHWGQSWRVFVVACAAPSALGAFMVWNLVSESPRYLAIHNRQDEALTATNKLAIQMRFIGALYTQTEMLYNYPSQDERFRVHISARNPCEWVLKAAREGWVDFMASTAKLYIPQLRQTTWPLQAIWFSLNFGSYGILTWINSLFVVVHLENVYFNALLFAISNLPGNLLSGFLMDRTGRKYMLSSTSLAAAASLMAFAYFAQNSESKSPNQYGVVVSACSFQAFTIAAWNTIDCMTSERFPTDVRSTGLGVCAASGRIGAMIAQFINGSLLGKPVRLLMVASCSLLIGAFTPFLLPSLDFYNRALEDESDGYAGAETTRLSHDVDGRRNGPYTRIKRYQTADAGNLT